MKAVIFLDMDGVLVDCVSGIARHFDLPLDILYSRWVPGVYDIHHALGLDEAEAWSKLDNCPEDMWENMPEYPWSKQLFDYCNSAADTFILTAPRKPPSCFSGKVKWLYKFAGPEFGNIHITKDKWHCARMDRILIDDKEQNIEEWIAFGGHGILFPNHCNKLHHLKNDPLSYVIPILDSTLNRIAGV